MSRIKLILGLIRIQVYYKSNEDRKITYNSVYYLREPKKKLNKCAKYKDIFLWLRICNGSLKNIFIVNITIIKSYSWYNYIKQL